MLEVTMENISRRELDKRVTSFVSSIDYDTGVDDDLLRHALRDEMVASTAALRVGVGGPTLHDFFGKQSGAVLAGLHWFLQDSARYIVTDIGIGTKMDEKVRDYGDIWAKTRPGEHHLAHHLPASTMSDVPSMMFRMPKPGCGTTRTHALGGEMVIPSAFMDHVVLGDTKQPPIFIVCHLRDTTKRAQECLDRGCSICGDFWKAYKEHLAANGLVLTDDKAYIMSFYVSFYVSLTLLQKGDVDMLMGGGNDAHVLFMPDSHGSKVHAVAAFVCRLPDGESADIRSVVDQLSHVTVTWMGGYSEALQAAASIWACPPEFGTPSSLARAMYGRELGRQPKLNRIEDVKSAVAVVDEELSRIVSETREFCDKYISGSVNNTKTKDADSLLRSLVKALGRSARKGSSR
jgi:hypothetical protein